VPRGRRIRDGPPDVVRRLREEAVATSLSPFSFERTFVLGEAPRLPR